MRRDLAITFSLLAGLSLSCAHLPAADAGRAPSTAHEGQIGTLWVTSSPEFEMIAEQAYALARIRLDEALADGSRSALAEGQSDPRALPPAVILDVDETVLDNSPYQAQLILDDTEYGEESWREWVELARAKPIPGAVDFIRYAASRGVQVIYLTNRDSEEEAATRRNLLEVGFPIDESDVSDAVLTKGEREEWGSDKKSRRDLIAETHRVVMLVGDDLNDFVSGARADEPDARKQLAAIHQEHWALDWIVLPNPLYGSWEASLFGRDYSLSRQEKIELRNEKLEGYR